MRVIYTIEKSYPFVVFYPEELKMENLSNKLFAVWVLNLVLPVSTQFKEQLHPQPVSLGRVWCGESGLLWA